MGLQVTAKIAMNIIRPLFLGHHISSRRMASKIPLIGVISTCGPPKECEQSFLEELTASDQSDCSDNDDSSGTDDLTAVEVIDSECSDNESDDVQRATASSAPAASSTFAWEDMTNYVGQREQFVHNYGP